MGYGKLFIRKRAFLSFVMEMFTVFSTIGAVSCKSIVSDGYVSLNTFAENSNIALQQV